jgi:hypothetical protein
MYCYLMDQPRPLTLDVNLEETGGMSDLSYFDNSKVR